MPTDYLERSSTRTSTTSRPRRRSNPRRAVARLGNRMLLKREDLQPVFSFKLRGAYNKMARLSAGARARGVIAASAAITRQGVALAAQRLRRRATIVMPMTTPRSRSTPWRRSARRSCCTATPTTRRTSARGARPKRRAAHFVHPYDDPDVIAGQGTIGMEILRQCREPIDAIFVPVGGGGLIAGIAAYVKRLRPEIAIIGVEPKDAACHVRALDGGRAGRRSPTSGIFADGVAVTAGRGGAVPDRRAPVDEVVLVDTDEICAAIKDVFEDTRSIAEPAGALAVAGAKRYVEAPEASRARRSSRSSRART